MRLAVALLALLSCASAWAQDAAGWMLRMSQALKSLDYHGDLVYAHAGQIETLRVFHAAGPDGERERLVSMSGVPREVIRAGGRVICIGTGARASIYAGPVSPLMGALPGSDAAALQTHYALALGAQERVAGLQAQLLDVLPRDAFRYGYRLWLDTDTGMLLKSVRLGSDGRPVEQLMFTRIALRERPSEADLTGSAIADATAGAIESVIDRPQSESSRTPAWLVIDPPAGFALAAQQPVARAPNEHLVYSDGVASVSVYVEPLAANVPAFSGPASRGALNLYGRVLDGRQITVLGDVPAATVERFAQGVAATGGG